MASVGSRGLEHRGPRGDTYSERSRVEWGRLFDRLAMAEDSQAASATDAPRIRTIAAYRA